MRTQEIKNPEFFSFLSFFFLIFFLNLKKYIYLR